MSRKIVGITVGTSIRPQTVIEKTNQEAKITSAVNSALNKAKESGEFKGDPGDPGAKGENGTSVTVASVNETTIDDGYNFVNFSDGKQLKVKNGSKGSTGDKGDKGDSVTISNIEQINNPGGSSTVTFSDGSTLKVRNGNTGSKGDKGDSITVTNVSESTEDGGSNVVTFSDGKTVTVKNGSKGSKGSKGYSIYYTNTITIQSNTSVTASKFEGVSVDDLFVTHLGALFRVSDVSSGQASLTYLTTIGSNDGSINVSANVGDMLVVKEVDIDGKPTKWEAVERTHWKEERQAFIAFDGSVKLTSGMGGIAVGSNAIKIGEKYVVTWNGKEYTCVAKSAGGSIMLGNAGILSAGEATGEPFVIEVMEADYSMVSMSTSTSPTIPVKIETRSETIYHKLDPNYLPDEALGGGSGGSSNENSGVFTSTIYASINSSGEWVAGLFDESNLRPQYYNNILSASNEGKTLRFNVIVDLGAFISNLLILSSTSNVSSIMENDYFNGLCVTITVDIGAMSNTGVNSLCTLSAMIGTDDSVTITSNLYEMLVGEGEE